MGLFLCPVCDEHLSVAPHTCDPEKIRAHVERLDMRAREAEHRLDDIRNAVYKLLQPLPSLEGKEELTVSADWLRALWRAANCRWHEATTADSFLVCWIATHRTLSEAFDVFRAKKYGKAETPLEKLQALREACDAAKRVLGYEDSKLDMSPEDVLRP